MALPTILFNGDDYVELLRTGPDLWELETKDPVFIALLKKMGFPIYDADNPPAEESEPASDILQAKPAVNMEMALPTAGRAKVPISPRVVKAE